MYAERIRKSYDGRIYLGCEGIEGSVAHLTRSYDMIPYYLYERNSLVRAINTPPSRESAVYIPILSTATGQSIIGSALSYVKRRAVGKDMDKIGLMERLEDYVLLLDGDAKSILEKIVSAGSLIVIQAFTETPSYLEGLLYKLMNLLGSSLG